MEIGDRRTPDAHLGPEIGRGRDAVVYAAGSDRVLRRGPADRHYGTEARVMEHLRLQGYPVPRVWWVRPGEIEMDRVSGPTMLDDLASHPWRVWRYASLLGLLHRRLHALTPPTDLDLPSPHGSGSSVLHRDLHPGNVLLGPDGPVVIDWTNVALGPGAADVAVTWVILGAFAVDGPRWQQVIAVPLRRLLLRRFLAVAGREKAREVLPEVAAHRLADRNVRPAEATAIRRLMAHHRAR